MSKKDKWPFWPEKKKLSGDELAEHLKKIDDFQVELDVVKYNPKLFEGYDRIVVLGPQRSGTTFTAKAISNTLGEDWHYIDEGQFIWLSGEPSSYTNWNNGEPNNMSNCDEDYVIMYGPNEGNAYYSPAYGKWNDDP